MASRFFRLILLISVFLSSSAALAAYPDRPIHIYVPFAPGGAGDVILRLVTEKLSESLGQPVIVEYKPGADTQIGADAVAKAKPDGYTLGLFTPSIVVNKFLYKKSPYDLQKDLRPVATIARAPGVILVNPSLEAKDLMQFAALGKRMAGRLNFSSSSTIGMLMVESLNQALGIQATHVPYKGSSPSITAVMAGDVQYTIDTVPMAKQQIAAGRLRALGVTSKTRSPEAPAIPTLEEAGLPDFEFFTWWGLLAPAGVPDAIVSRLNTEIGRILLMPEIHAKIDGMGASAYPQSVEGFNSMLKSDLARYDGVIQRAKLSPVN